MTILVTGASGFVGSSVIRCLLDAGQPVRVMTRPTSDRRNFRDLDVEVVHGDLHDPASLTIAVAGCSGLYHVAADYRLWAPDPATMFKANVEGTVALMRAALQAKVERIVYTSSVATMGIDPTGRPADEETPVAFADMIGPYKQSKFRAEEAVRRLIAEEGLPAVIVNPSTPVGPRDVKPTPTGRMIVEAAAGRMPAYVDTGLNIAHVDDVAAGHLLAFEHGQVGRNYILGGEDMSLRDILAEIARLTARPPPRVRLPHDLVLPIAYMAEAWTRMVGRGEPFATVDGVNMARKRMFFSSSRANRELGYVPRPALQALADAVAWFRANS
jgi:dihydroflavonol-4-reductase